ncbi:MAG: hypothetical protein NC308_06820 [Clostridium sp.]|nr:hypothetical protein [Bacteroides sp.]MCM1198584.1 hypothetical protein [Clostridium sp.]
MNRHKKPNFIMAVIGLAGLVSAAGAIVMLLWNWLVPDIFGLAAINFWQASGLYLLGHIMLGGIFPWLLMTGGIAHSAMQRKNHIHSKWHDMTDEERQKFAEEYRRRFHHAFGEREERNENR